LQRSARREFANGLLLSRLDAEAEMLEKAERSSLKHMMSWRQKFAAQERNYFALAGSANFGACCAVL